MWNVLWQNQAVDDLLELLKTDPRQGRRVRAAIEAFGRSGQGDVKALRGRGEELRLRVGDWRVIIEAPESPTRIAYVSRIRLRRDAYD